MLVVCLLVGSVCLVLFVAGFLFLLIVCLWAVLLRLI